MTDADTGGECTLALRALMSRPFLDAAEPEYALVRRHERALARTLQEVYGYQLELSSTAARASGSPSAAGLCRPIRIRPASASGQRRPVDQWPALSDRSCLILLLTLVALERSGTQIAIAELAREVERAAADVPGGSPVTVDFRSRGERTAFADGLDLLCQWGILAHIAGSHESYTRREQGDDEAFFTIDHRRLALLIRDPARALTAGSVAELTDESERYAPTQEGDNRRRFEMLARRLTEDPVLLLDDLDETDRSYFLSQRARIEDAVAGATGYAIERRREGTALITDDRGFTDLPFPTNATVKQVALLLCDTLSDCGPDGELDRGSLHERVHVLVTEHGQHWGADAADGQRLADLAESAIETLTACDLARPSADGRLRPTPLSARFREPSLRMAGEVEES